MSHGVKNNYIQKCKTVSGMAAEQFYSKRIPEVLTICTNGNRNQPTTALIGRSNPAVK